MSYSTSRPLVSTRRPASENPAIVNYVLLSRPDELGSDETEHPSSAIYLHPVHGQVPISFPDVLIQNIGSDQYLKVPICYANENAKVVNQSSPQTSTTTTPTKQTPPRAHPMGSESLNSSTSSFSLSKSEISTTTARPTFNAKPINIPDADVVSDGSARTSIGIRLRGRIVDYVIPGGPAFLTGKIKENDEIIAIDGVMIFRIMSGKIMSNASILFAFRRGFERDRCINRNNRG